MSSCATPGQLAMISSSLQPSQAGRSRIRPRAANDRLSGENAGIERNARMLCHCRWSSPFVARLSEIAVQRRKHIEVLSDAPAWASPVARTALSASPSRKTRASSPMPASATRTARCSPAWEPPCPRRRPRLTRRHLRRTDPGPQRRQTRENRLSPTCLPSAPSAPTVTGTTFEGLKM